jgi:hypothetical protein
MTVRSPEQLEADAAETEATLRYLRQRRFAGLLGEAIAHADALWRLESALRQELPAAEPDAACRVEARRIVGR